MVGEAVYGLMAALDSEKFMDNAKKAKSPKFTVLDKDSFVGPYTKVREILFYNDRMVREKWGYRWQTDDWVLIPEGGTWPDECFMSVELPCCKRWFGVKVSNPVYPISAILQYCPECGRKMNY